MSPHARRTDCRLAAFAAVAGLAGCGTATSLKEELDRATPSMAAPGMPRTDAVNHLTRAGFACQAPAGHAATCSRTRNAYLIAGCMERIDLGLDVQDRTVERVTVQNVLCAGL